MSPPSLLDSLIVVAARLWIRHFPLTVFKETIWRFAHWRNHRYTARVQDRFVMTGRSNDIVQGYAYYFGVWEPNLTAWMIRRLTDRKNEVFVDVGANVGYYSLLAESVLGADSAVVSIEASPMIHKMLEENILLNRTDRIRTVNCAAAARSGTLTLFHGDEDNLGGTTANAGVWNREGLTVQSRPLTDILSEEEVGRIGVIKIDVEGAEWDVIVGLVPMLPKLSRDVEIVVEILMENVQKIVSLFDEAGFNAYALTNYYSYKTYLQRGPAIAPTRLRDLPTQDGDFIFSRRDATTL